MNKIYAEMKVLKGLRELKKMAVGDELSLSLIRDVFDIINGSYHKNEIYLADCFESFQTIFEYSKLTPLESGYIFSKLMEQNYSFIYSEPYSFLRVDKYCKEFAEFGIPYKNIGEVYMKVTQGNYQLKLSTLEQFENWFGILFDSSTRFNPYDRKNFSSVAAMKVSLENNKFTEKIVSDIYDRIISINQLALQLKKNEANIQHVVHHNQLFQFFVQSLSANMHVCASQIEDMMVSYLLHEDLSQYEKDFNHSFKEFVKQIREDEEKERLNQVQFYREIAQFHFKKKRDIKDYQRVMAVMVQRIPKKLVEDFVMYYMDVDGKPLKKVETVFSKNQMKNELLTYYKKDENVLFDYHNLSRLISLLKKLNYSDSVLENIFGSIQQNAILNDAFYAFLIEKKTYLKTDKKLIDDLKVMLECLCYDDAKSWEQDYQDVLELCKKLCMEAHSFDYELQLVYSKKR